MSEPTTTSSSSSSWLARLSGGQAKQKLLAFASLIALILVFTVLKPDAFMTQDNIIGILQSTTVIGVLAIASTFIIITSGIDLSVGVLMTFCAVMAGVFMVNLGMPMPLGIVCALAMGALSGCISGLAITKLKVPPFIATLGMMMLLKGASLIITNTRPIYFNDVEGFDQIALGSWIGELIPSLPIPNGVLIMFVVAVVCAVVLNKTALGRYTFALGSNEEAVRLSGVNVDRWKVIIYTFAGGICGIAGLLIASRLNSAQPRTGSGLRTGRDCGRGDWRHLAQRRGGYDFGNNHRRVHHECADQRSAHHVGRARMADGTHWSYHHSGGLH